MLFNDSKRRRSQGLVRPRPLLSLEEAIKDSRSVRSFQVRKKRDNVGRGGNLESEEGESISRSR